MDTLMQLAGDAPVSWGLIALIVGTSLVGLFVAPAVIERNLFRPFWLLPRREYHTLVTSGFIHADLPHLLFNTFTLWAFALSLERRIGSATFVALYAVGLFVSAAGTWLNHRKNPAYQTLGASGAILAVLFASIVYFPSASLYILPIPVPIPAPLFALSYLAFTWYASRRSWGRVNHDAHLSGALAGVAFVAVSDPLAMQDALRSVFG